MRSEHIGDQVFGLVIKDIIQDLSSHLKFPTSVCHCTVIRNGNCHLL